MDEVLGRGQDDLARQMSNTLAQPGPVLHGAFPAPSPPRAPSRGDRRPSQSPGQAPGPRPAPPPPGGARTPGRRPRAGEQGKEIARAVNNKIAATVCGVPTYTVPRFAILICKWLESPQGSRWQVVFSFSAHGRGNRLRVNAALGGG